MYHHTIIDPSAEVVYLRTASGGLAPVYIRDEPAVELPKKMTTPSPDKQPDKKHGRHGSTETGVPKKPLEEKKRHRTSSMEAKPASLPPQSATSPRQSSPPPQGPPPAMSRGTGRPHVDSKKKKRSSKEYS